MKMNPSRKKTLILVIVLLLCAAFASFWTARQNRQNDAAVAVITYQGKDIRTVDLSTVKETETFTLMYKTGSCRNADYGDEHIQAYIIQHP